MPNTSYIFDYGEEDSKIILELSEAEGYDCDTTFMNDMVNLTIKNLIKKHPKIKKKVNKK